MANETPWFDWEELRRRLRERPFRPFRLHLVDGRVLDIRFPDLNLVGRSYIMVGIPEPNNPDPIGEYSVLVLLNEIRQLEELSDVAGASPR
jgi:hypothetical protein